MTVQTMENLNMFRRFDEQMKAGRQARHMSQAQVAKVAGVTPGRIGQMENGEVAISTAVYNAAFACSVDLDEAFMAGVLKQENPPKELELLHRSSPLVVAAVRRARKRVRVVAITANTRLGEPRRSLLDLLDADGTLDVALVDPCSEAFRQRATEESFHDDEWLPPGSLTRRLEFEWWATVEGLKGLQSHTKQQGRGKVRVVTYDSYPEASITIVDSFLCEVYRYRKGHRGPKEPSRLLFDAASRGFKEAEKSADAVFERGRPVSLEDLAGDSVDRMKPVYLPEDGMR